MSKALSETIIDKCVENPKFAFLLVPLGLAVLYFGISDARYYRALSSRPTQVMKEVSIVSKPNEKGFTIPFVVGKAGEKEVSIPISSKAARNMQVLDQMEIVETADNSGKYELRSSVDSHVSSAYFTIAETPFNFISLLGLGITLGALGWGILAKPRATAPKPETTT